ncbi:ArsS family sensor histidine kinase [Sulfurospirillum arcachonense]|uniref:ArsS family sensor histidine kinase n=1 Tax=Sulfurospirillum arcachonense TaxID=57666 RepID=UPI0004683A68|nr:ArsS family sensor histidine kinase [Sulfurospirillum arcachonense]
MTKSSIFYSITFIFLLSLTSILLASIFLLEYDKQDYSEKLNKKYSIIARSTLFHLNKLISKKELQEQIQDYSLSEIIDKEKKKNIITQSKVIQKIKSKIGSSSILKYDKHHYLLVEHQNAILLFKDNDYQPYRYDIIKSIFGLVFGIIILSYIITIRKIKPLRRLKRQMDKFASGNLDIHCNSEGEDEISQVSNAFQHAVEQIKKLNSSRQLFLRNIMHELKTPITKGRISAEMIDNEKQRNRLINVFEKLELLINEFASIEQITSGEGTQNIRPARLIDIIDESIDLAMAPSKALKLEIDANLVLNVDFRLFTTAIKNLIDNGIKYSLDHFVIITATANRISFISKGSPLEHDLEHYLQPFIQEKNSHHSFGLGLYIVDNIVKAHNIKFKYRHQDGLNYFYFENIENLL